MADDVDGPVRAEVYADGQPSRYLRARLDVAYELFEAGKVRAILVSGDNGTRFYNETDGMRDYLADAYGPRRRSEPGGPDRNDLPPGVRCTVVARPGFQSHTGEALRGTTSHQFQTGGPFVRQILPGSWTPVEEEQFFILQLNGPATPESVQAHVWCALQGVGERVPVRLIDGPQRRELLRAQGLEAAAAKEPQALYTLACNRRFTSGTQVQLVYGKGVATPSGLANSVERRTTYKVRDAFAAEFACERENAQAGCLPIRPMLLSFNAPVPRKLAAAIRLKSAKETLKPQIDGGAEGVFGIEDVLADEARPEGGALEIVEQDLDGGGEGLGIARHAVPVQQREEAPAAHAPNPLAPARGSPSNADETESSSASWPCAYASSKPDQQSSTVPSAPTAAPPWPFTPSSSDDTAVAPSSDESATSVAAETAARAPSAPPPRTNELSKPLDAATLAVFATSATTP